MPRAIFSWFPVRPGTGLASLVHVLMQLTEPVLAPVRRVIPPAGMFDISFIVVLIGLELLLKALNCRVLDLLKRYTPVGGTRSTMTAMEITPRELRDTEIHSEIRGYSRDEVNDLLEQAAQAIEASNQRVTQLQDRLTSAQSEAVRTRETEDILHRTLLFAQRAADEAVAEATAKSRQMLDEAEMSSRRLVADAEAEARRKGETERRRLEQEIVELAGRRDTLLADVEALTRFEAEYRERMVRALESDLSTLRTRPTTAPASLPETSEVEIPASLSAVASPVADDDEPSLPAVPVVRQEVAAPPADAGRPSDAPGIVAEAPSARSNNGDSGVRTDTRAESRAENHDGGAETSEVDVRTLFEQSREQARVRT